MKLGLHINDYNWPVGPDRLGPTLAEIARVAEGARFAHIGVADHVWQDPRTWAGQTLRSWSATRRWRSWLPTPVGWS